MAHDNVFGCFRTFLDSVPDVGKRESSSDSSSSSDSDSDSGKPGGMGKTALLKDSKVKQRCNYERYRTLIQNDYLGVEELACLKQIYLEEEMGGGANSASGGGGATGTGDKLGKGASNSATPKVGSSNYFYLTVPVLDDDDELH